MTKLNLHEATREDLVDVAGFRPFVAEAVLKARDERGGEIASIDALKDALAEVKGIGPATLDQLGEVLKVSRAAARHAAETSADAATPAAKAGAEEARRATEKPAEATASGVKVGAAEARRTTEQAADVAASGVRVARRTAEQTVDATVSVAQAGAEEARRTVERTAEVTSMAARGGVEAVSRTVRGLADAEKAAAGHSGEMASELSQLVARLIDEQVRANVETLQALVRARTWREALEVQGEFFRGNVERMTQGTRRYVETVARLATGLAEVGRDKGDRGD